MKMLVMSDTHGDSHVIEKVKGFYPEIDIVVHCGDSELPYSHEALEGLKKYVETVIVRKLSLKKKCSRSMM